MKNFLLSTLLLLFTAMAHGSGCPKVKLGIDLLFEEPYIKLIKGKQVGLITNQTGVNGSLESTIDVIKSAATKEGFKLVALFGPEHGIDGSHYASENVGESKDKDNIPIFSLYGKTKRPTAEMLKGIDILIFDIQDIGSRSYTFITTMFMAMEEAAKQGVSFLVLDRPNPMGGMIVDGPLLEEKWRSTIGYIDIPYCHGMTVAELARFFNEEYGIHCKLEIVPMKGWTRRMTFQDTGLFWIPTSPNIPEPDTPYYYATTGIIGDFQFVNIGIGYTLPFKLVGAPWINASQFAKQLNSQNLAGVYFKPYYFRPLHGRFAGKDCQGVLIVVTDPLNYKPVSTCYIILGTLKSLYPKHFQEALAKISEQKSTLCKLNGSLEIYRLITEEKYFAWKLLSIVENDRKAFAPKRKKYLLPEYDESRSVYSTPGL